ncbi:hypothetical protein A6R68_15148 [Neotoma lepida]|uniref:G-protein coupled receptors family 1 profile domain-containing protein n=1 Tax=Neotoma lepida TaxID=56216 RepID=A0A1A6H8X9_NEOLE|nr:hypothetical protein A6R68_15148 [Neotoma lepida]
MNRENGTSADFILLGLFPELRYLGILISSILLIYFIAFTGNAILVLLIWADSRLHTPMYILLSHLSLIDLALISTTVPKMAINFFSRKKSISKVACGTQIFFFFALGGSECLLLTLMAYDRYVAVCNPLRYSIIMNSRVCLWMALASWGGGALNSLINTIYTMHFPFCGSREIHHFFCEMPAVLKLSCEDTSLYETVVSVICIVFVLLPLGLIMSSYLLIFLTVLRMNSPEGRRKAMATCSSHLAVNHRVSCSENTKEHLGSNRETISGYEIWRTPALRLQASDLGTELVLSPHRAAQQEMGTKPWNYSTTGFVLTSLFNNSQLHLFLFSMVVLVYILAMAGNTAMVLLIWMDTRLHTPMYFLLSQLSFLDIFFTSVTVPKMIVGFLFGWTSISFGGCGAQMFFFMFLGAAECLLLALMAYDRYVAICNPLRYPVLMSRRVCLLMVVASWLGGSLNASIQTSLTLQFPYCGSRKISHFFCEVPSLLMLACADTEAYEQVLFVTGVVVLLVPITFITTSYALILAAVLRMRSVEGRQKALATCSSHLTVVNLFYGPLVYTYMLPASYHSPGQDDVVSVFYTVLTPMLNPVIYSLRNKEVTGAMKKVMARSDVILEKVKCSVV